MKTHCIAPNQSTSRHALLILLLFLAAILITALPVRAIEIANDFTYGGTNGFAASHALATDFNAYPVFSAVGSLSIYLQGDLESVGSATLLDNEWVLTAGHCWSTSVTNFGFVLGGVSHEVDMSSLVLHPMWANPPEPPLTKMEVGPSQGWDLALFKLKSPITNNIRFPELYTKSDELGKVGITLGAGRLGTGDVPWYEQQTNDPPLIHAAFNVIDRTTSQTWTTNGTNYGGGFIVTDFDGTTNADHNTLGISYYTNGDTWIWDDSTNIVIALDPAGDIAGDNSADAQYMLGTNIVEGGAAPGDSGGPTFIEDGGEWKLAGVTSWGSNPWDELYNSGSGSRGLYGDVNYMVRISETSDWIYSVIPEPSTYVLLTLGTFLAAFIFLRKKRIRT